MAEKVPRDLEDLLDLKVYSKNPHKKHVFWGFRVILFLYFGFFLQNQPKNILKIVSKN